MLSTRKSGAEVVKSLPYAALDVRREIYYLHL